MQVKNWHPGAASPAPAQIQNIRGTPGAPPHARGRRRRRPRAARAGPVRPGSARGGRPAPRAAHPPARPRLPRAAPPAPPARARPPPRPAAAGRPKAGRTLSRKLARPRCSACCRVSRPNAPGSCGRRTRPPRAAPPAPLERAHASAAPLPARACADACAGPLSRVGQPCPAPTRPVQARKTPGRQARGPLRWQACMEWCAPPQVCGATTELRALGALLHRRVARTAGPAAPAAGMTDGHVG